MCGRRKITICLSLSWLAATVAVNITAGSAAERDARRLPLASMRLVPAQPADPAKVVSADGCVKCHASEVAVWRQTPHARTFVDLHRRPEAKVIARRLGVRSIKYDDRCVACHYTQRLEAGRAVTISGVSCESCHGAAADWLELHHDYGGPTVTRQTESPQHRRDRIAAAVAAGMRNPANLYQLAQSCYRCHTVQDEPLVNVGGHHSGSWEFELVSWSQGMVRHNFVRSDGRVNQVSSAERLRIMFVAGMIADLEASLRAVAVATEVASFGQNAARRAARAAARLRSVLEKTGDARVAEAITIYDAAPLQVNQRERLTAAADQIAQLGVRFAAEVDPQTLSALDPFIPVPDRWK
jgi:hypothetical protein